MVISTIVVKGVAPKMPEAIRRKIVMMITKRLPWEADIKWDNKSSSMMGKSISAWVDVDKNKWSGRILIKSRDMSHHETVFLQLEGYTMSIGGVQLTCNTSNSAGVQFTTRIALR